MERKRHWIKGDCHLHTTNSDGVKSPEELYEAIYERGLDFAFITDHNFNTVEDKAFNYKGVTIIPGLEITGDLGHVNGLGENIPIKKIDRPKTEEEYKEHLDKVRQAGAMVSVNHPHDRRFGWDIDRDHFDMDSVEVWNAPMHNDNSYCLDWWHGLLMKGHFIPAIGGSDYHQDYLHLTNLLASPTTYIYAYSNTPEDVAEAIRAGHAFVTNSPSAARIFLSVGDAIPGDTVELAKTKKARVEVDYLRKGQKLRIFCNNEVIYCYRAKKHEKHHVAELDIPETGFIRADVRLPMNFIEKKLYAALVSKLHYHDKGEGVPEFIYSFTNPIFVK